MEHFEVEEAPVLDQGDADEQIVTPQNEVFRQLNPLLFNLLTNGSRPAPGTSSISVMPDSTTSPVTSSDSSPAQSPATASSSRYPNSAPDDGPTGPKHSKLSGNEAEEPWKQVLAKLSGENGEMLLTEQRNRQGHRSGDGEEIAGLPNGTGNGEKKPADAADSGSSDSEKNGDFSILDEETLHRFLLKLCTYLSHAELGVMSKVCKSFAAAAEWPNN